jgi:hypothetical protein
MLLRFPDIGAILVRLAGIELNVLVPPGFDPVPPDIDPILLAPAIPMLPTPIEPPILGDDVIVERLPDIGWLAEEFCNLEF